jgi:hypothetical protein
MRSAHRDHPRAGVDVCANALNGVVNVITKTPREVGTTFAGFGGFPTDVAGHPGDRLAYYANGSHAGRERPRAYRMSLAPIRRTRCRGRPA